ncbi:MAG: nicotinate phosphoribosyltransferase [Bacteroidales bacterium]
MINYSGIYTDLYQLTMAQVYFLKGKKDTGVVFDYFFRKLPFKGGYALFAGLGELLEVLSELRFSERDLDYLLSQGFDPGFVNYLSEFRFSGNIYSFREGDIIFPVEPVVQVEADIIEAQIIETILLNILNFQSLVATKASRIRSAAGDRMLSEFGLRRSQGAGGYSASRAAIVGGFDTTSNVRAACDYGITPAGTMAHSYIESYDDELTAFRDFAEVHPDKTILLIDTYNTLASGLPNAIRVAREMEERGGRLAGVRLDSGDLAWLAGECRRRLDAEKLDYVKIVVSNQLDEYVVASLIAQGAPIDIFGVGTSLVTGAPEGALDGVYKLSFAGGKPRIKLSENEKKITLPYKKQVYRMINGAGMFCGADMITIHDEVKAGMMFHPWIDFRNKCVEGLQQEPLLKKVMENGNRLLPEYSISDTAAWSRERLKMLPAEYKRFENPHIYKVGISERLKSERHRLIAERKG